MASGKMRLRGNKEGTAEWTGLFIQDLKTKQESLVFVKRMMAIAVSSVTYLRGIFPESAYRSRYLDDLCIKVLRENSNTPGANKVVKWMMGCFDALEKQYLHIICIGVYTDPEDRNCIIESYQFNFRYTEMGPEMDISRNNVKGMQVALEDTKRASVLLIRKLFLLLQNLDALPSNVYLTMKLYYYDDSFQEGVHDRLWFQGVPVHFKVGQVHTAFHSLRVRVSVEQGQVKKLQEGNYGKEPGRISPRKEAIKRKDDEGLPSEDESAQFKKPSRPLTKKKAAPKSAAKKKRRN
ncbi:zebrafish testis-expressed 38 isoform X2 [Xiphophorus couchianus]|uniref:zebrafish testis-expressed 38 isoform X2 n=1 Tax=Xiphophorus couchianus TaxID=32473 RepID=UPI001016348E|nr:HORMA domain-containing protein 1-like isoform X2 [Xiphophorus couchianus]